MADRKAIRSILVIISICGVSGLGALEAGESSLLSPSMTEAFNKAAALIKKRSSPDPKIQLIPIGFGKTVPGGLGWLVSPGEGKLIPPGFGGRLPTRGYVAQWNELPSIMPGVGGKPENLSERVLIDFEWMLSIRRSPEPVDYLILYEARGYLFLRCREGLGKVQTFRASFSDDKRNVRLTDFALVDQ